MAANEKKQVRISIINVPANLAPLKLRGFLKSEADDIQAKTPDGFALIQLFLPERIRLAVTQKKLDVMLENIVNKYPNIYRIELVRVKNSLNIQEMHEVTQEARDFLTELAEKTSDKPDSNQSD